MVNLLATFASMSVRLRGNRRSILPFDACEADALNTVWTEQMKWFTFLISCNAIAVNSIIHSFRNNVSFCRSVALPIRYDNFRSRTVVHRRHRCAQKDAEKSKRRIIIALDSDAQKSGVRTARCAPWYPPTERIIATILNAFTEMKIAINNKKKVMASQHMHTDWESGRVIVHCVNECGMMKST